MKEFKVRSNGKLLLFFYFVLAIAIEVVPYLYFTLKNESRDEIIFSMVFLFIPVVVLISSLIAEIRRKNIPTKITIDEINNTVTFTFNKGKKGEKTVLLQKEEVAYTYQNERLISSVTIYYKMRARRGHIVTKRYFMIIGSFLGISWSNAKLAKINRVFVGQGYEQKQGEKGSILTNFFT